MFESILLICTGNICRSPIAERILLQAFPQKKIASVGLEALVGHPADATAARVAATMGISLAGHTARSFDLNEANKYALLLVMEQRQLEKISLMAPQLRGKVMLLGRWNGNRDIPDPYKKSDAAFESVLNLIALACDQWVNKLGTKNSGNKDDHNDDQ
ncbi:protein tyrosine phosphatase [Pantoea sp. Acro-805]|jgi:protein-tyrosine phosphatase|uniref:protein-tyrosine-phosphatase n=1 Tax=Candidatus Pantoea formicae TaxID=2608355 RepID=A0ABX0QNN6_9GAMM|nr:protein tyrosine phosphatase [Pantoea formicae]MDF7649032.1 protein tyrosine phosphatase [Erwiniaceae bacterium L1_54_3]NIE98556.1 protein tyrosine phosphatase [Pantoea formicae]